MSLQSVRKCDECAAIHGVVNNWWCVIASPKQPLFVTFEEAEQKARAGDLYRDAFRLDYCSHACVGTAFHRWLDTGSVVRQENQTSEESD
jgi:hypothetical protein